MAPTSRPCFLRDERESGVSDTDTGSLEDLTKSKGSPESPKTRAVHLFRGTEGGKAVRAELVLEPRRQVALGQLWSRNNVNTPREAGASRARLDTAEREGASDRGRVRRGVEEDRRGGGEPRRGDCARGLLLQRKGKQEYSLAAAAAAE